MTKPSAVKNYFSKYLPWLHTLPADRRNEVQSELRGPEVHIVYGNGANHHSQVQVAYRRKKAF